MAAATPLAKRSARPAGLPSSLSTATHASHWQRQGYPEETIEAIKACYTTLFRSKLLLKDAMEKVERELGRFEEVRYFLEFVRTSARGVCR